MGFRGGASGAGNGVLLAPPSESIDLGDVVGEGVSNRVPRADHRHAVPAPADATMVDVAAAKTAGAATTPARADHVHGHTLAMHVAGGHADLSAQFSATAYRVTTGAVAAAGTADVVVALNPAMPDLNYTVDVSVEEATAGDTLRIRKIVSRTVNQVVVRVANQDIAARTGTLHLLARHDSQNPTLPTYARLAAANAWTADNFFGSGRPWYDLGATATPDGVYATDGVILAGSLTTLTCASAPFSSYYVGKAVVVSGAGVAGASLVTTIASYTSPTQVTLATAATAAVNPADVMFGTDNTTAINALFALAIGEHRITRGQYLVTAPLTLPAICQVRGSGRRNAVILNNNSNIFNPAATMDDSTFEHFAVQAGKGAGHIFNFGLVFPGTTQFSKLYLAQHNPLKSIFTGAGIIDVDIEYSDLYAYGARSVPIINFVGTSAFAAVINDNRICKNRIEDWGAATEYMIWLETQNGFAGTNNRIIDNTLEQPVGGGINLLSMANTFIENNPAWDAPTPSAKHIINIGTSAVGGTPCFATHIRKQSRQSGGLAANVHDINITTGGTSQTDITECSQGGAPSPFSINVAPSGFVYGTVIERCGPGVVINGYAPTLAAGGAINASPGAALSLDAGSTPYEGTVTVTTGTAPATGEIVVVTLGNNTFGAVPASVTITGIGARGDVVPDKNCWVSAVAANEFKVSCLTALPASVVFQIGYKVNRRAVV